MPARAEEVIHADLLVWSAHGLDARLEAVAAWYRRLLEQVGAATAAAEVVPG